MFRPGDNPNFLSKAIGEKGAPTYLIDCYIGNYSVAAWADGSMLIWLDATFNKGSYGWFRELAAEQLERETGKEPTYKDVLKRLCEASDLDAYDALFFYNNQNNTLVADIGEPLPIRISAATKETLESVISKFLSERFKDTTVKYYVITNENLLDLTHPELLGLSKA